MHTLCLHLWTFSHESSRFVACRAIEALLKCSLLKSEQLNETLIFLMTTFPPENWENHHRAYSTTLYQPVDWVRCWCSPLAVKQPQWYWLSSPTTLTAALGSATCPALPDFPHERGAGAQGWLYLPTEVPPEPAPCCQHLHGSGTDLQVGQRKITVLRTSPFYILLLRCRSPQQTCIFFAVQWFGATWALTVQLSWTQTGSRMLVWAIK